MQITLNQDEIEEAIRVAVNHQVNIREGHEITIDLKAGRGENGFSATIEIVPAGVVKAIPVPVPNPPRPGTVFAYMAAPKPVQTEALVKVINAIADQHTQEAASTLVAETVTETPVVEPPVSNDPADAPQAAVEAEAAPVEEKPKSLFAALGKPRNPA